MQLLVFILFQLFGSGSYTDVQVPSVPCERALLSLLLLTVSSKDLDGRRDANAIR